MTELVFRSLVKDKKARARLSKYESVAARHAKRALKKTGDDWTRAIALTRFRGYTPAKQPDAGKLRQRTGALRNSMFTEVRGGRTLRSLRLTFSGGGSNGGKGAPLIYAKLQETGGVIRPTRAKFLAFPIGENVTGAGDARFPSAARYMQTFGKQGTGVAFTIPVKGESRSNPQKMVIVEERGSGLVPMFFLTKEVKIPGPKAGGGRGRLQFFRTVAKHVRLLRKELRKEFRLANIAIQKAGG